jgi:hypothetical protein
VRFQSSILPSPGTRSTSQARFCWSTGQRDLERSELLGQSRQEEQWPFAGWDFSYTAAASAPSSRRGRMQTERVRHHAWHYRGTRSLYAGGVYLSLTSDHDDRRNAGEERSLLRATTGPMPAARDRRVSCAQPGHRTEHRSCPTEARLGSSVLSLTLKRTVCVLLTHARKAGDQ